MVGSAGLGRLKNIRMRGYSRRVMEFLIEYMVKEDAGAVLDVYESTNENRTGPLKRHRGARALFNQYFYWPNYK